MSFSRSEPGQATFLTEPMSRRFADDQANDLPSDSAYLILIFKFSFARHWPAFGSVQ
jgi:hypothetical protein